MTVSTNADQVRDELAPVYAKYQSQTTAQPAYLEIDPAKNTLTADYSGEIGNAVPEGVWHNRILRVSIPNDVSGKALADFMESDEVQSLAAKVIEGHSVEWDGNNHVGRLSPEADAAFSELESLTSELEQEVNRTAVWDAFDWLNVRYEGVKAFVGDDFISAGTTDAELEVLAEKLKAEATNERVVVNGIDEALSDISHNCRDTRWRCSEELAGPLGEQAKQAGLFVTSDAIYDVLDGQAPADGRYEGFVQLLDKDTGLAIMDVGRGTGAAFLMENVNAPIEKGQFYSLQFKDGQAVANVREQSNSRGMER